MMNKKFKLVFNITNLGLLKYIPGLEKKMQDELMEAYNIYADRANAGITDLLNSQFELLFPDYFVRNKGKEWYELKEYNQYLANGYDMLICYALNKNKAVSRLLEYYVEPDEIVFTGRLKINKKVAINFYLKEVR